MPFDLTFCPSLTSYLFITGHQMFKWSETLLYCGFSVSLYLLSEGDENSPPLMYVCVVISGFQDRKVIIKTMKTYMVKFATVSSILHLRKKKLWLNGKEEGKGKVRVERFSLLLSADRCVLFQLLWIAQSFHSKCFIHLSRSITAVKSQERVVWAQCDVAQNSRQLQQNSWSQPDTHTH